MATRQVLSGDTFPGEWVVNALKEHKGEPGDPWSKYDWTGFAEVIGPVKWKLAEGQTRAAKALPENAPSVKRTAALKRYIAAVAHTQVALDELECALGDIEDSV